MSDRLCCKVVRYVLPPLLAVLCVSFFFHTFAPAVDSEDDPHHFVGFRGNPGEDALPSGWVRITYPGKRANEITLEKEGKRTVLRMKSLNSVSALMAQPDVEILDFPVLVWCWRINRVVGMAREDRRDRNDCAARIRVVFSAMDGAVSYAGILESVLKNFGISVGVLEPAGYKIDYVWGNSFPRGAIIDYPGASRHKIVCVESGEMKAGRWIWEKRDLVKDFATCFDGDPEGLSGIIVLSDTDHTNEGVEAGFSSIVLMKQSDEHEE